MWGRSLYAMLSALWISSIAGEALAEPCNPNFTEDAKNKREKLLKDGRALRDKHGATEADRSAALALFKEALRIRGCDPEVLSEYGRTLEELGATDPASLVAAYETFSRVRSIKPTLTPEMAAVTRKVEWGSFIQGGEAGVIRVEPRVGVVTIHVTGGAAKKASATLEGQPFGDLSRPRAVVPGTSPRVVVRVEDAPGYRVRVLERPSMKGGERWSIELSTEEDLESLAPAPAGLSEAAAREIERGMALVEGKDGVAPQRPDWEGARAAFDRAVDLSGRHPHALYDRARASLALGRRREARLDLDAASCAGASLPVESWVAARVARFREAMDGALALLEVQLKPVGHGAVERETSLLVDGAPLLRLSCAALGERALLLAGGVPGAVGTPIHTGDRVLVEPDRPHVLEARNPRFAEAAVEGMWPASGGRPGLVTLELPAPNLRYFLGYGGLATAGAALVTAGILGGSAAARYDSVPDVCADKACSDEREIALGQVTTRANVAIGFGAASGALALVGALFVWQPWSARGTVGRGGPPLGVIVGATGAALRGSF